jgi:hypothetical protein
VPAGQRERLERVGRYVLRPPVAIDRLHLTDDGRVRLSLRHPWSDGTTDWGYSRPWSSWSAWRSWCRGRTQPVVGYPDAADLPAFARLYIRPDFGEASPKRFARRRAASTCWPVRAAAGDCGSLRSSSSRG